MANIDNKYICVIDENTIYSVPNGQKIKIGKTITAYEELEATIEEYYNKLVELGVIVPPKTQDEINEENQEIMKSLLEVVTSLKDEIKTLKGESNEQKTNTKNSKQSLTKTETETKD